MMKDDTYCVMPFLSLAVKPDGKVKPCCRYKTWTDNDKREWYDNSDINHNIVGSNAALHSKAFESVRQDMLCGKKILGCEKCYAEETHGSFKSSGTSMRQWYNRQYKDHQIGKIQLKYLEVSFGNYCNLSCRTCDSALSTSWYDDEVVLSSKYDIQPNKKILDIPFNWTSNDFKNVNEIKFVGGEPMLNPNFHKFLQTVIDSNKAKHIKLTIFTNCSWFPKNHIIDLLKNFSVVNIWLSIDAVGDKNDYIRNKSNWNTVHHCASKWLNLEKKQIVGVVLTPAVGILNAHILDDLIKWWIDLRNKNQLNFQRRNEENLQTEKGDIVFSPVITPIDLSVLISPLKQQAIKKYKRYADLVVGDDENAITIRRFWHKAVKILSQKTHTQLHETNFISLTKDLDKLRKQDFKITFPELYTEIKDIYDIVPGKL